MKLKELIEELSKYDEDAFVVRTIPETNRHLTAAIENVEFHETDFGNVVVIN